MYNVAEHPLCGGFDVALGLKHPSNGGKALGGRQAWRGEAVDLVALESPVAGLGKLVVRGLDTGAEGAEVLVGVDEGAEEGKGVVGAAHRRRQVSGGEGVPSGEEVRPAA
jgi:hypothetical protein